MAVDKLLYYCDFPISQVGGGAQQVRAISSSVNVPPTPGYPLRSSQTPLFLLLTLCLQGRWLPSCPCAWKAISKAQGWAHLLREAHQGEHSPSSDCHGFDVHTLSSWFCRKLHLLKMCHISEYRRSSLWGRRHDLKPVWTSRCRHGKPA